MPNKVKFGLKNVYYAVQHEGDDGAITYDKPVAIPGAVSLSADAQGDINNFYADDRIYWKNASNNGYEGDLEIALIPDSFRTDVLGEELDENGVLLEDADATANSFALLFEFNGDANKTRHALYNCTATRPEIASQTTEDSIEPVTETITVSASPLENGRCHVKTTDTTDTTIFDSWFEEVYCPWAANSSTGGNTEPDDENP